MGPLPGCLNLFLAGQTTASRQSGHKAPVRNRATQAEQRHRRLHAQASNREGENWGQNWKPQEGREAPVLAWTSSRAHRSMVTVSLEDSPLSRLALWCVCHTLEVR